MPEVDYVVITAGSFDLMVEVVCEDDDHLLEVINKRIRDAPRRARPPRRFVYLKLAQADLHVGNPMTDPQTVEQRRRRPARPGRATTCGCTSPACRRTTNAAVPIIVRGEGTYIWDDKGKRYLDGLAGLFVVQAGHGRTELAEAAAKQASELAFFPLWSYAHPKADRAGRAPRRTTRPATSTGSSSPPAAARPSRPPGSSPSSTSSSPASRTKHKVISRVRSPTTAPRRARCRSPASRPLKAPFEPLVPGAHKVPNTNIYRAPSTATTSRPSAAGPPTRSSEAIVFEGPDTVAAVFLEPVQNSGGCFPPPPGYFQRVREICDQHDVLLVSDEVICAFGRLGTMFACDTFGYVPDMITCAKGMTSGYSPIGAMIASDRLIEPFLQGDNDLRCTATPSAATRCRPRSRWPTSTSSSARSSTSTCSTTRAPSARTLEKLHDLPIVGDVRGDGLLLRHRAGQGQGDQGDLRRRRVRAAAARLPVQGAVRGRPVLPGRRPRRPGRPARPAADLRPGALRRDRADPALGADRGVVAPLGRTAVRRLPEKQVHDRAVLDAVLDAGLVAHVAVPDERRAAVRPAGRLRPRRRPRAVPRLDRRAGCSGAWPPAPRPA